jgi:TPR repeat protein
MWGVAMRPSAASEHADQLKQAAQAGDADAMWDYAQLLLGTSAPSRPGQSRMSHLVDVAKVLADGSHAEARDWVQRSSEAGNTQAMVVQAIGMENTDREDAERLLGQAADRGDTAAMLYLGAMRERDGNRQAARDWFTKLADRGDDAGMVMLGELLITEDPQQGQAVLEKAAQAGNVRAQSDVAVAAFEAGNRVLDPNHPPAQDPRDTGVFGVRTPVSRRKRVVADCMRCGRKTVQDVFEIIVSAWLGPSARMPTQHSTAGKVGRRAHYSACTVCGCLYPVDAAARKYVQARGGEFFNPAKLSPERRARAARAMRPRLAGQTSVLAIILGVAAFFAAPLVWGTLGILMGLSASRGRPRQKLGLVAIAVSVLGLVVGTVLHYKHPFGYG